jgi:hypothetical protein
MRISACCLFVAAFVYGGCGPRTALLPPPQAPPDVVAACQLASERCAHCHPIERVKLARVQNPQQWQWYVARMRLQPHSGISLGDQYVITRCLVVRSFGLEALEGSPR